MCAFFLLHGQNGPTNGQELRQAAMQQSNAALQRRNEALKVDTTTTLPQQPKKDSASVDIMEKRSVHDGPFRPPRSFEDPEYGKIEIHFGCLPGGDVELPSDDEQDEQDEQDEDTREQALRKGFPPPAAPSTTAAARNAVAPPVSSTIPNNQAETKSAAAAPNAFGLQMQATVTHFRMNSGISNVAKTTTTPPVQPPPPTLRPGLVTSSGKVGHTPGITGTNSRGPSLYETLMIEKNAKQLAANKNANALDPDTHGVTTIKASDIAPSFAYKHRVAELASSSHTSPPASNTASTTPVTPATPATPYVLAPVATMTEEMVRISELRRDNPKLAGKIMMQGSLLVAAATEGNSDVLAFEKLLQNCKSGEFLQWHVVKALQGAAQEGHLEIVQLMIKHGAPLRDIRGKPLGVLNGCIESGAAVCGNVIEYLIQNCQLNVDYCTPPEQYTYLHDACMRLDYPTVKLLVELGAGVNSIAADDAVPLGITLARARAATPPMHVLTRTGAEVAAFQRSGQPQMAAQSVKMLKQAKLIEELLRKKGARETWRRN